MTKGSSNLGSGPGSEHLPDANPENVVPIKTLQRKLAAILFADVVGYSALANEDEEGTHKKLRLSLDAVAELIGRHEGTLDNYAGDAVLADFPTASAALACAFEIQKLHSASGLTDDSGSAGGNGGSFQYRIGINLGEVILDRDDIYGDGVNIAARVQGLARTGGICITQAALSAVGNKLKFFRFIIW